MPDSKNIQREFYVDKASIGFTPITNGSWSSFMNTYAVHDLQADTRAASGISATAYNYSLTANILLEKGSYYITGAVDSSGSVIINGVNFNLYGSSSNISRTTIENNYVYHHTGGTMRIVLNVYKQQASSGSGVPSGIAVTISKLIETPLTYWIWGGVSHQNYNQTTYSVGDLVWSTRAISASDVGRYVVTMPFRASITAHAWGGGGGGGGVDAGTLGGFGSPGLYNTTTFTVNKGDSLEVFVGSGGLGGASNSGSAPGGAAGRSRINLNGDSTKSFNGGAGSAAGSSGSSGGGGGGGGASGILVNSAIILVAGGGAGGGGAGNDGNGSVQTTRRDAQITNNAIGAAGFDYRGENGQTKSGDGGGAGGGGGGYPGGQGGPLWPGDSSGYAGQCGGNLPVYSANTGVNTAYYKSGFAGGGARGGGSGQNGRVVLIIDPIGVNAIKIAGEWKQMDEAFVKVSGSWKSIDKIFVRFQEGWKEVGNVGQSDITLSPDSSNYSVLVRT